MKVIHEYQRSSSLIIGSYNNSGWKGIQVSKSNFLLKAESAMKSDQVNEGFIQSGLENPQGW